MFEFLAGLLAGALAVGSIWFWIAVIAAVIIVTTLVENEQGGWATFTAVAAVVAFNYLWKVPVLKSLAAHPWAALGWLALYFAAGAGWGLFKWTLFVHKKVGEYEEFKAEFLAKNKATELTPELASKLADAIKDSYNTAVKVEIPTASAHKGDIVRWMTYWPFSAIGFVLNDFVRKIWNHVYTFMAKTYDRIAARLYKGVTADMQLAADYKASKKKSNDDQADVPFTSRR